MARRLPRPTPGMLRRARQLRRDSTFPERLLWSRLRDRRCGGFKWRRQYAVGPYVVDFYCAAEQIVIELDGRSHDDQQAKDAHRQAYLELQGLRVLRITNDRLLRDLKGVVEAIWNACESSLGRDAPTPP